MTHITAHRPIQPKLAGQRGHGFGGRALRADDQRENQIPNLERVMMIPSAFAARPSAPIFGAGQSHAKEVHLRATATGFEPANPSIPAGTKVVIVVDARQAPACATPLQVDPLGVSSTTDASGRIELTIPPQQQGAKLELRCGMGMLKTKLNVTA